MPDGSRRAAVGNELPATIKAAMGEYDTYLVTRLFRIMLSCRAFRTPAEVEEEGQGKDGEEDDDAELVREEDEEGEDVEQESEEQRGDDHRGGSGCANLLVRLRLPSVSRQTAVSPCL